MLKDKGVLITGAGRGIGKRLALGFAAAGARVGLVARGKPEIDLVNLEIQHSGGAALRLRADVRDFEQLCAAADRMRVSFGGIHVLICAAAVQGPVGPFVQAGAAAWAEVVETNLIGVMNACRAVLPEMIGRRAGKIIALSCGGASAGRPNFAAYAASKAALARFVESLAGEVRDDNVQINCMCPGPTYTHMTDEILSAGELAGWKEQEDALHVRMTGGTPPERQLDLAKFLASERSNHVTGRLLDVNDDWKRLEHANLHPEIHTLRRIQKV